MRRKAVVKYQPTAPTYSVAKLAGRRHVHFCSDRECRMAYECACDEPEVNGRCNLCRGTRRPLWVANRDPQDCCVNNCAQITDKAELHRYQLAGPGPWFQCKSCARCHGWPCVV